MNDPSGRLQIHLQRQAEESGLGTETEAGTGPGSLQRPGLGQEPGPCPGSGSGLKVTIHSSRLVGASRVFIGKDLAETARTLPSLFSVCATAQAAACALAAEAALGIRPHPRTLVARRLLVDVETVREHLWRLLLDWPRFLGGGPDGAAMAQVMGAFGQFRRALAVSGDPLLPGATDIWSEGAATPAAGTANQAAGTVIQAAAAALAALAAIAQCQVLGQPPGDWLATIHTAQALSHWSRSQDTSAARLIRLVEGEGWGGLGRSPVAVLPPLTTADLNARLSRPGAAAFIATPLWQGAPAETTPFARQLGQPLVADLTRDLGNGLLPRLAAQLVEVASLLADLPRRLATLADPDVFDIGTDGTDGPGSFRGSAGSGGSGLAQVQAARGLLVHRLTLEGSRVTDYRILAPTEWNFHPRGAAALGLAALPAGDDATLRRLAGLFITALDPCVAYDIRID